MTTSTSVFRFGSSGGVSTNLKASAGSAIEAMAGVVRAAGTGVDRAVVGTGVDRAVVGTGVDRAVATGVP